MTKKTFYKQAIYTTFLYHIYYTMLSWQHQTL